MLKKLGLNDNENLFKLVVQFIKFGIVGALNTLISLAVYYIFIFISDDLYLIGNAVGLVAGIINSYYWNGKYVFADTGKREIKTFLKTFVSYSFTFALSTSMLFIMVEYMNISNKLAPIIVLTVTIPLNFILNKFWAFK